MTREELIQAVDTYFLTHLDKSFWAGLASDSREAAVSMALDDILSELPGVTLEGMKTGSFAFKAVAEQAVYLARNYESLSEGKVITGEGAEGVNASYTLINANAGISFRAAAYIQRAKSAITGGSLHISRG